MSVTLLNLCWNQLEVSKDTVRRALKEPEIDEVIVVDNGSTDGTKEYYRKLAGVVATSGKDGLEKLEFKTGNQKLIFIDWPVNAGASVARNLGISIAKGDYIFLIDGDILYVPGTVKEYQKILEDYPDAACVGQNSFEMVVQLGHNGTQNAIEADARMEEGYTISDWFPMAWTQYGLFRAELLRQYPFIEEPPYNEPGYGYEDDDLYHQLREVGYVSLAVDKPLYYHEAHGGIRELMKADLELKLKERKKVFEKRWGKNSQWSEWLNKHNPERTTRPKP
ncbi:MAG: glycosyltransferase family 2 protein [Blastocatellia bacterium]|nr:glycosyltransferase family 2 protein [Blastocatellia bacterium]